MPLGVKIFGILNITPDSFSDGGMYSSRDAAAKKALQMIKDGADVIDIGGMSTRPGFTDVSEEEELERILPVITSIKEKCPDAVISVDTFRARTALATLNAGASIINDITGLQADKDMAGVIAEKDAGAILMRNGFSKSLNLTGDLDVSVKLSEEAGISKDKIYLDPGIGFTDSRDDDIKLIKSVQQLRSTFGLPVLVGASRKRITAQFYNEETEPRNREGASLAVAIYAALKGAGAVRVHDVKQTAAALKVMEKLEE